MDLGLKGRVAIVAAASKGLGKAVAAGLAREGAQVSICARTGADLHIAASEIEAQTGQKVFWKAVDVTKPDQVRSFVEDVAHRFGGVDICVTNTGGPPAKNFLSISLEEWHQAVDLVLLSAVYFAREVLPRMLERHWGRLIFMASMSVKQPIDGLLLSNSLRAGVAGLAKTLANEFGKDNILVNTVCPGYTLTERLGELAGAQARAAGVSAEEIYRRWAASVPLQRLGKPEELAALVVFLASEKASYLNGTTIAVDGGYVKGLL